jgi:hypothetical protein
MQDRITQAAAATACIAALCAGSYYLGYTKAQDQRTSVVENHRPAEALPGGGILVERVPGGKTEVAQPDLPRGATPVRTTEVDIQPPEAPVAKLPGGDCPASVPCPKVRLRLDLLEHADGTYGVTAVTDKGEVVGGVDIPLRPVVEWKAPQWAVGLEYEAPSGDVAIVVDRDLGPFRVGGGVEVKSKDPEVRINAKWVF